MWRTIFSSLAVLSLLMIPGYASASTFPEDKTIDELISDLQDEASRVRIDAARELGERGYLAAAAVEALIQALDDENHSVKSAAAIALGKIGPEPGVIEVLSECLAGDDSDYSRGSAITALGLIGEPAAHVVPLFIEMMKGDYPIYDDEIIAALANMGASAEPALPYILRYAKDIYSDKAKNIHRILLNMGLDRALDYLMRELEFEKSQSRIGVPAALAAFGEEAHEAVPLLMNAIREDNLEVAAGAVRAIGKISADAEVVDLLIDVLMHEDIWLRQAAADALGEMEGEPRIIDALQHAFKEDDSRVASRALYAVNRIGRFAPDCLPMLMEWAGENAYAAIEAIGKMGADAKEAVPYLLSIMDPNENPSWIINALGNIAAEADEGIDGLIVLLNNDNNYVREYAITALEKLGPREMIVNALAEIAGNGVTSSERITAIRALSNFAPQGIAAIPVLIDAMDDEDTLVRVEAERAFAKYLGNSGVGESFTSEAVDKLREGLYGGDHEISSTAGGALTRLGREGREVLFEGIKSGDENVRFSAAISIANAGYGKIVLRHLIDAFESEDDDISKWASNVIESIGPEAKNAVPRLVALAGERRDLRLPVARVLIAIGPEPGVVDTLMEIMDDDDIP